MILLQQSYESPHRERQAELDRVREINAAEKAFTQVVPVEGSAKRWTFADFFRLAEERFSGRVCVVSNSDIAFDGSIALAAPLAEAGRLVALTRWDDASSPSMEGHTSGDQWHFYSHSQDAWIFKAGGLPAFEAGFQLGIPACESRLAFEAAAAGVIVVDPAFSIRCHHHHASAVRSWRRRDGYRGPMLFPRLTTCDRVDPEALFVDRTRFTKREWTVRLTGCPDDFRSQITRTAEIGNLKSVRIGLRSPFYVRKRG
jgi:hypothetical protein